jgi:hypothetical protein
LLDVHRGRPFQNRRRVDPLDDVADRSPLRPARCAGDYDGVESQCLLLQLEVDGRCLIVHHPDRPLGNAISEDLRLHDHIARRHVRDLVTPGVIRERTDPQRGQMHLNSGEWPLRAKIGNDSGNTAHRWGAARRGSHAA